MKAIQENDGYTVDTNGGNAIAVTASFLWSSILLDSGKVLVFGDKGHYYRNLSGDGGDGGLGYLGLGTVTVNYYDKPQAMSNSAGYDGTNAVSIGRSKFANYVLLNTGKLLACGANNSGQLGIGVDGKTTLKRTLTEMSNSGGYDGTNCKLLSRSTSGATIILNSGKLLRTGKLGMGKELMI